MSIQNVGPSRWLVRVRVRCDGAVKSRKRTISGNMADARRLEVALIDELAGNSNERSLKLRTFGEALQYYREHTDVDLKKNEAYFNRLERDLGLVSLTQLPQRFGEYWRLLRDERAIWTGKVLSTATRNRILSYSKIALNFCVRRGLLISNPLAAFQKLPETPRDRVLSEDEQYRLLAVLKLRNSYLYWPVRFSLKNPIRKGDIIALKRENLDWFKPWIHFYPSKTRKRKSRETCLPFLDDGLLKHFEQLPDDCPYLFPRIDASGEWHPLGDFKRHWHSVLKEARISDFHWHDLKHCAVTWILDNGYSERDIKNLGIQYDDAMIDRYYHADASKVLRKWKESDGPENVAPMWPRTGTKPP